MIAIDRIRREPEQTLELIRRKGFSGDLDNILKLDSDMRESLTQFESKRSEQKKVSKQVGIAKRQGKDDPKLFEYAQQLSDEIKNLEAKTDRLRNHLQDALLFIPNIPDEDVPIAPDERGNILLEEFGEKPQFDFSPLAHWDIGDANNMLDPVAGATIAGSGFNVLRKDFAKLERSLIDFMIDIHTSEHGFEEIATPFLARGNAMEGTGQLPKFADDMYRIEGEDLYLIPTAEVSIANTVSNSILKHSQLPIKLCGYTPCFRKEAGAAGRDTRGMIRVHQFSKVEMIKIVKEDESVAELDLMVKEACTVLSRLGLQFRTVLLSTGDMSFSAAKTIDIEVYCPGVDRWLEVSSCSNCRDFQSRRMRTRYKDENRKNKFVHILNGSGVALPRLMIAIIETYQQKDKTIAIPNALKKYFPGRTSIG